jgi:hypothetical protein
MRCHELALQQWLNRKFFVREGYPVPVVFATPMDAFGQFTKLWSQANNPFQYLLDAKDDKGTPLYQPYPNPVRYPLLSVYRKGWRYRSYQNFSIHRFRHLNWPTVSTIEDGLGRCELGNVMTSKMPLAYDYRFQINHFTTRPDSQAFFLEKFVREFQDTGGLPQCWIPVWYPIWGMQLIRVYIDGDMENASPEDADSEGQMEYNTAATIVMEGFSVDVKPEALPALWYIVFGTGGTVDPEKLEMFYTQDARILDDNVTLDSRPNVPPDDVCQENLPVRETFVDLYFGNPDINPFPADRSQGTPFTWPLQPGYPGGIPPSPAFGIPVLTFQAAPVISASGTDAGAQQAGFQVGSLELQPHLEASAQSSIFSVGTLALSIIDGGTVVETPAQFSAFFNGTAFLATVVSNAGTEAGGITPAFQSGTLAQVIVEAGTLVESGAQASSFASGTNQLIVLVFSGTEFVGNNSGFFGGSLDS